MKITIAYLIGVTLGFLSCMACYELHFKTSNECKKIDGKEICRTIMTEAWREK